MRAGKPEKILVVQTSFLGDVVLTTPLFAEIKRLWPRTGLSVLCTPQGKSLLEGNPHIDAVLVDDKKGRDRGWLGLWRKARELKGFGFSIALSPHKSLRTGLMLFLAEIPYRVGFRQSAGWFFYHKRVERNPNRHDVERNLSLLGVFGVQPEQCQKEPHVEVDGRSQGALEDLFRSLGIGGGQLVIGINPGSVWATKRWVAEGYARLIGLLKQRYSCNVLLFGAPEDREITDRIQRLSENAAFNLAGRVQLSDLAGALQRCDLFITNDSGPMHIAVAQKVPVVAIFCATTPSLGFYPYSSRAVVIEKELACRPCSSHGGRRCPLGSDDCMRLIRAEDVLRGVEWLLNAKTEEETTPKTYLPRRMIV